MNMSMLFDIPQAVCVSILENFESVKDLGRLDSAFCNHANKGKFLALLSAQELTSMLDTETIKSVEGCAQWSVLRHVHFRVVNFETRENSRSIARWS